jgi:hypothetical protein
MTNFTKVVMPALLLGLACDDPAVTAKVAEVMEHGAVKAYVHCEHDIAIDNNNLAVRRYEASLFQDGSSLAKFAIVSPYSAPESGGFPGADPEAVRLVAHGESYLPRGVDGASSGYTDSKIDAPSLRSWLTAQAIDGVIEFRVYDVTHLSPHTYLSNYDCGDFCNMDMATYCTGFNLSAFGVVE